MLLFNIGELIEGNVVKRPSEHCKTPYVADVNINNLHVLAHTAALGCCGLSDKGSKVLMIRSKNNKNVCSHKIILSEQTEKGVTHLIGIDPKNAEEIVEQCLKKNCLRTLKNATYKREQCYMNSRFDFKGVDEDGKTFILEVKNVPLADYVDCSKKERKHMTFEDRQFDSKISYFPDGYRKNTNVPVSERALKHINELKEIRMNDNYRTILCFVIQRTDISSFQPSIIDIHYRQAVQEAVANGVELLTVVCKWDYKGNVYFVKEDLPINLF
tara:strand:+ start:379 stop:1191 length:813 start_codon:yes stop_codon:yes gene_type:complete